MDDVAIPLERDNYRFELVEDDFSGTLPQIKGTRLMKDEYIDGEIARDMGRTFPHHLLFRHKENGCQEILESVLRKISDSHFGLGYCQGMNYVVGAIMVSLLDPELNGYYSDNDTDELQERVATYVYNNENLRLFSRMDAEGIRLQVYDLSVSLIDRLQLVKLWGYGFPDVSLCSYVLRKYLQ